MIWRMAGTSSAVGVDPAAAILEIATNRPGGSKAEWVLGDTEFGSISDIVTYQTSYKASNQRRILSVESIIRFTSKPQLARMISASRLHVDKWLGDW